MEELRFVLSLLRSRVTRGVAAIVAVGSAAIALPNLGPAPSASALPPAGDGCAYSSNTAAPLNASNEGVCWLQWQTAPVSADAPTTVNRVVDLAGGTTMTYTLTYAAPSITTNGGASVNASIAGVDAATVVSGIRNASHLFGYAYGNIGYGGASAFQAPSGAPAIATTWQNMPASATTSAPAVGGTWKITGIDVTGPDGTHVSTGYSFVLADAGQTTMVGGQPEGLTFTSDKPISYLTSLDSGATPSNPCPTVVSAPPTAPGGTVTCVANGTGGDANLWTVDDPTTISGSMSGVPGSYEAQAVGIVMSQQAARVVIQDPANEPAGQSFTISYSANGSAIASATAQAACPAGSTEPGATQPCNAANVYSGSLKNGYRTTGATTGSTWTTSGRSTNTFTYDVTTSGPNPLSDYQISWTCDPAAVLNQTTLSSSASLPYAAMLLGLYRTTPTLPWNIVGTQMSATTNGSEQSITVPVGSNLLASGNGQLISGANLVCSANIQLRNGPALTETDNARGANFVAGVPLTYTFTATNNGYTTLHNVLVSDPDSTFTGSAGVPDFGHTPCVVTLAGGGSGPREPNGAITLNPGDSAACRATYTPSTADVAAGSITNRVNVHGVNGIAITVGTSVDRSLSTATDTVRANRAGATAPVPPARTAPRSAGGPTVAPAPAPPASAQSRSSHAVNSANVTSASAQSPSYTGAGNIALLAGVACIFLSLGGFALLFAAHRGAKEE